MSAPFHRGQLVSMRPATDLWGTVSPAQSGWVVEYCAAGPSGYIVRAAPPGNPELWVEAPAELFWHGGNLFGDPAAIQDASAPENSPTHV